MERIENITINGVDELHNIKEGKSWIVGNVVYDTATKLYYICTANNTDNFIDLQKWSAYSMNNMPHITISGYKVEVV